jgi:hypothetical protein
MTSPSELLAAAVAFTAVGSEGMISERYDIVELRGRFDEAGFARWTDIAAGARALGVAVSIRDEIGDVVTPGHFSQARVVHAQITITKPSTQTTFYFLTVEGLQTLLADDALSSRARRVLTGEQTTEFASLSCAFERWTTLVADTEEPDPLASVDPRRFVRDLALARVPRSVGDALLASAVEGRDSAAFLAWRDNAVRRLRAALANEIASSVTGEIVTLQGSRTINADVEPAGVVTDELFDAADEAGHWVYASGPDIDTRHVMFTHELAREWQEGRGWYEGFPTFAPRALASAKNVYRKHLAKTSNETLKALADLRKTLNEEIVKVTQQTRDLGAGLWRDFAVVLTAIVARVALIVSGNAAADSSPVIYTMYGVAVYLALTLSVALYANARFGAIAKANRLTWRESLYGFLSDDDFKKLAEEPLTQASGIYRTTAWAVAAAYAVMIAALIGSAMFLHVASVHEGTTSSSASNSGAMSQKTTAKAKQKTTSSQSHH